MELPRLTLDRFNRQSDGASFIRMEGPESSTPGPPAGPYKPKPALAAVLIESFSRRPRPAPSIPAERTPRRFLGKERDAEKDNKSLAGSLSSALTPSDEEKDPLPELVCGVRHHDGRVEVAAFDKHPEEVGHHEVVEDCRDAATPGLDERAKEIRR
ncbi:UNVERIFIED_CONTAM: hypothetical protein K2H54_009855 [Gekko kuhli]